ncbi:hypothetical protein PUN28_007916 [Cardiocondyla obscurior]|uniref:Uncharacterized protein n=1 Tax=Cardiocondyla obscurior TaxID=286306 RepID=A0AAW2FWP0_9HYME
MGARQSKRSVDITTTPKKEGVPAEGGVVGDAAAPGDGKLERIEEADTKPTTNGIAPHTDSAEDKEKDKDETTEKDKEQPQQEEVKVEETKQESSGDSPTEVAEVTTPTEATPASPNAATPDNKETKKKEKKKKWSFRSISFSKKDKTKPNRDETPKNGDVTKEEPLAEGGEDAEIATAAASSPEEKSAASSPSADEQVTAPTAAAAVESKEEADAASPAVPASSVEEKKKEPTPSAPTPVPSAEDKKEEAVENPEVEKKVVEVSQSAGSHAVADPVTKPRSVTGIFYRIPPVATPSIIEKKANEDLPPLPPSSPPPTPIDPSPLQQDRQAAANATALAEALKLPAVTADKENSTLPPDVAYPSSRKDVFFQENSASELATTMLSRDSFTDNLPLTLATFVPEDVECLPVVKAGIEVETSQDAAKKVEETLENSFDNKKNEESSLTMEGVLETIFTKEEKEVPAMTKDINETLPVMESQTKSEINSCDDATEIDALSHDKLDKQIEAEMLKLDEIESKDACRVKKILSPDEMTKILNDIERSIRKIPDSDEPVVGETDLEEYLIKKEDAIDEQTETLDKLINEDVLVEAKPALIIPEDDSAEERTDTSNVEKNAEKRTGTNNVEKNAEKRIDTNNVEKNAEKRINIEDIEKMVSDESDEELLQKNFEDIITSSTEETEDIIVLDEIDDEQIYNTVHMSNGHIKNEVEVVNKIENTLPCPPEDTTAFSSQMSHHPLLNYADFSVSKSHSNKFQTLDFISDSENAPAFLEDLPPAPEDMGTQSLDSFDYPLPPEDLSCPSLSIASPNMSVVELAPVEHAASPRNPTETLLTPPVSPSFQSNITPAIATETATKDRSQIPSYYENDSSNREQSMLLSEPLTMSCNQSDVELKERLVAERVAKTESQEEALSCQLSNSIPSTATKEHHQNAPEIEVPVENNIAHDVSTTESADEAPKVAPPAIPVEAPASPPTAPAITEDVASVTKAIEEIGISDKAVAAAVNESIESNTNEIITDARYQNDE